MNNLLFKPRTGVTTFNTFYSADIFPWYYDRCCSEKGETGSEKNGILEAARKGVEKWPEWMKGNDSLN
jgi:hypothetical protein